MLAHRPHPIPSSVTGGIAVFWVALSTPVAAQEIHADLCLHGCPSGSPITNDIVIRDIYILSSNDATKFADWVAYRVTREAIGRSESRNWKSDPWLADNETLEPPDYTGANAALGTDRGHQAPLASFTSTDSWRTTNYLSNITPQESALNQGVWVDLETAVRTLAERQASNAVYVITGPLYERQMPALPQADEDHRVPSGYWKIIATETANGSRSRPSFLTRRPLGGLVSAKSNSSPAFVRSRAGPAWTSSTFGSGRGTRDGGGAGNSTASSAASSSPSGNGQEKPAALARRT